MEIEKEKKQRVEVGEEEEEEEEAALTTHSRFNYSARVNTHIDA